MSAGSTDGVRNTAAAGARKRAARGLAIPHWAGGRLRGYLAAVVTLVAVVMATVAGPAARAGAQGAPPAGEVRGTLVNGTGGGAVPAGLEVVLQAARGNALQVDRRARADEQGAFAFAGLELGDDLTYVLGATYAAALYTTSPFRLTAAASSQQLTLAVYEPAETDPGLRVPQVLLVIGGVDAQRQELAVMELVVLANPSDRAFVPQPGGAGGPMGLVRFGLPAGARDLQPTVGLDSQDMIQVDRGFGSLAPVPPGEHEFGYTYRLPYAGSAAALEKSFTYGAALVRVLVPDGGPQLTSPDLTPDEPAQIGGQQFLAWTGHDLAPGARLTLRLAGLPARPVWRAALDLVARPLAGAALFAGVLAAGLAWTLLPSLRRRLGPAVPPALPAAPPALDAAGDAGPVPAAVAAIAALDDAFAAGALPEPVYQEQRATLMARSRELLRDRGTAVASAAPAVPAAPPGTALTAGHWKEPAAAVAPLEARSEAGHG